MADSPSSVHDETTVAALTEAMGRYWGYDSFRPLQQEAMTAVLQGRDSLVVLPTGGGKSLCFQVPALCQDGLAVVVSPLISLMKDQVDSLRACGVEAAALNSAITPNERRQVTTQIREGTLKLLYVAPERLLAGQTLEYLQQAGVSFVAIDEAHCISSWGHDFRPEYRGLNAMRQALPGVSIHAYTATASERVRLDMADQLGLVDPEVLVGSFDRPNLTYRVRRGNQRFAQVQKAVEQRRGESGIVYCISRKEVEKVAEGLKDLGHRAAPYHAGLSDEARRRNQESFITEKLDVIVATVAFGMGIDKSNVRFVIHSGMPKSLENYQQESGRAGRDSLEADCLLLYTAADAITWRRMVESGEPSSQAGALEAIDSIHRFCTGVECRHRAIVRHFGQDLDSTNCGACDVCLGELDLVEEPLILAQKIVSCVARLEQRFGADYTTKVLTGSREQRILQFGHDQLSTYGLLKGENSRTVRDWIEQLVGQQFLVKAGEYDVLNITTQGRSLLRGEATPLLLQPAKREASGRGARKSSSQGKPSTSQSWEGVDRDLFEALREVRREIAAEQGVPAYIVFGDAPLRDMARRRPSTLDGFHAVKGVGDQKLADYGEQFVAMIVDHCTEHGTAMDIATDE